MWFGKIGCLTAFRCEAYAAFYDSLVWIALCAGYAVQVGMWDSFHGYRLAGATVSTGLPHSLGTVRSLSSIHFRPLLTFLSSVSWSHTYIPVVKCWLFPSCIGLRWPDAPRPISPECCRSSGDGHSAMQLHLTAHRFSASCAVFLYGSESNSLSSPKSTRHTPNYLPHYWRLIRLHSADTCMLPSSWIRTNLTYQAFSAAGPRVWNNLLTYIRQPDLSYSHFR